MAIYLAKKQMRTWSFSPNLSDEDNVKAALTKMAVFRQAVMDMTTLNAFARVLLLEDLLDVG